MHLSSLFAILVIIALSTSCASSAHTYKTGLQDADRSYVKYVSGAGGGKGVYFEVSLKGLPSPIKVNRFVVNGVELPPEQSDSTLTAAIFYASAERIQDDAHPEPENPVLFNAATFEAVIHFSSNGVTDSVKLDGFKEGEQPMLP